MNNIWVVAVVAQKLISKRRCTIQKEYENGRIYIRDYLN